jgi:UvrD-like helicase C-terminal domain
MSESTILKTTETILNRIELEDQLKIKNKAIGHAVLKMDDVDKPFWLMRFGADANHRIVRDFVGNPVIVEPIPDQQLKIGGQNIFRDSKLGAFIIQHNLGRHSYNPNGTKSFETIIKLKSDYSPSIYDGEPDAIQGSIEQLDFPSYKFASLRNLIKELKDLSVTKERLEAEIEQQKEFSDKVAQLKEELSATEAAILEKQMALKRHMSYEIQLRERGILDKYQEAIKRSKVLNGTLIINGGPGTGKTTMLIQRITYLTTPTIEEVFELNEEDKNLLFNKGKSWIFFSPSELLRTYLDYAMRKEGLNSDKDNVTTWELFKQRAAREYGLINSETRRPFIYQKSKSFYKSDSNSLKEFLNRFEHFFVEFQRNKCRRSFELNTSTFQWHSLAVRIKAALKNMLSFSEMKQFISAYFNLNENFNAETQIQKSNYFKALNDSASGIQVRVENDKETLSWFNADFKESATKYSEEDDDLEDELEDDAFDDEAPNIDDFRLRLSRLLKRLLRKVALSKVDENTRLTKGDKYYFERIERFVQEDTLKPISEGAFFLKYFEKISRGIEINLIREFPLIYKLYRREKFEEMKTFLTEEGIQTLEGNLNGKSEKNRKATTNEFDFIFYWINSLVKHIYRSNKILLDNSKDKCIEGFKNLHKAVVAIDEATDFSSLELLAMSSFSHPKFNSVTLSGDLMQRMTANGLKSWEDFTSLIDNVEIGSLKIAYRQTPNLLKLASLIYKQHTGIEADFQSYTAENENYPSPLYYCDENEEKRIQWIADRIVEINTVYSNSIPTVAIFAKDDFEVSKVAHLLNNNQSIVELFLSAVPCVGGQILGDRQNIRVFPVEHIKGLEFESVFFWDIDTIETDQEDLVNKYIYVGLSRATFYLGITCLNNFPEKLSILKSQINTTGTWL